MIARLLETVALGVRCTAPESEYGEQSKFCDGNLQSRVCVIVQVNAKEVHKLFGLIWFHKWTFLNKWDDFVPKTWTCSHGLLMKVSLLHAPLEMHSFLKCDWVRNTLLLREAASISWAGTALGDIVACTVTAWFGRVSLWNHWIWLRVEICVLVIRCLIFGSVNYRSSEG